jgi:hypothetical protein
MEVMEVVKQVLQCKRHPHFLGPLHDDSSGFLPIHQLATLGGICLSTPRVWNLVFFIVSALMLMALQEACQILATVD